MTLLVRELLRRGERVVVATLSPDVNEPVHFDGPRLRLHVGPYRSGQRARDAFRVERQAIRDAILRERPDVVHAHWAYEFALGTLATPTPSVITLHDWAPTILRFHRDLYRSVRLGMQVATLARGRSFTAVSPYIAAASTRWRRPANVIPNGLPDEQFHEGARTGPDPRSPHLVSVNTGFGRRKNTTALLRAFRLLRDELPEARLTLIGGGYQPAGPAERWATANGLEAGVTFVGEQPHRTLIARVREADVLVHPSLEESFGMTLIEAMSQGTPVLAGADSGAVPWVLDHGRGGMMVDVRDAAAIAAATRELTTDLDRWHHWSEAGFANASTRFRMSVVADRYHTTYRQAGSTTG